MIYTFDIDPCPAPRMTRSDKWKLDPNHPDPKKRQRECVRKYFAFKNFIKWESFNKKYKLSEILNIIFIIPMPESWSKKKRLQMDGQPHKVKPDCDNMEKSWLDSFDGDDGFVWNIHAIKIWGLKGQIIVFSNLTEYNEWILNKK